MADPTWLGGTARISISVKAGATCGVSVRYPSGAAAPGLRDHPFTTGGSYSWRWTVPSGAGTGGARFTTSCTLGGVEKRGTGSFTILAVQPTPTPKVTPAPTWGITGSVGSASVVPGQDVVFNGSVTGTPPSGIASIDLRCELEVHSFTGEIVGRWSEGSVQTRDFTLTAHTAPATPLGAGGWKVTCYPTAPGNRSVQGPLTFVGG